MDQMKKKKSSGLDGISQDCLLIGVEIYTTYTDHKQFNPEWDLPYKLENGSGNTNPKKGRPNGLEELQTSELLSCGFKST